MNAPLNLSRRSLLIAATAAGATFTLAAEAQAAAGFEPTIWYAIAPDGQVVVNIIRAEMGQHVGSAIARIVAEELEADPARVRFLHVDSHPKWGLMVTGGSWSVWQSYPLYSQAAAAGRMALIEAGAKLLGATPSACTARNHRVIAGDKSIGFGEIVAKGALPAGISAEALARDSAQAGKGPPGARPRRAGPGCAEQDQRPSGLWHRRQGAGNGLRPPQAAAQPLRRARDRHR